MKASLRNLSSVICTLLSEEKNRLHLQESFELNNKIKLKEKALRDQLDTIDKSIATITFDNNGYLKHANSIFLEVSGFNTDDIIDKKYTCLLPSSGQDSAKYEMMWSSIKNRNSFSGQFQLRDNNNAQIWIQGTFNPILSPENNVEKIFLFGQFITDEKLREIQNGELVNVYRNIFPSVEIDKEGKLLKANQKFLELFQISRLELRKCSFLSLFEFDDSEQIHKWYKTLVNCPMLETNLISYVENEKKRDVYIFSLYKGKEDVQNLLILLIPYQN